MNNDPKLPLNVGWLQENGLLIKAANLLGYTLTMKDAGATGVEVFGTGDSVMTTSGRRRALSQFRLEWTDHLEFTIAQLIELGFALGDVEYCECCHKLKAECLQEQAEMYDHDHDYES